MNFAVVMYCSVDLTNTEKLKNVSLNNKINFS